MRKYPYSVGSAVVYSFILLATLWWLPVIGPIIIGYITGRKAGGPAKAIVAMSVPIFFYFFIIHAIHMGWVHIPPIVESYFKTNLPVSLAAFPAALPFVNYIQTTVNTANNIALYFTNYLYYAPPSFFIMFSFAFIGGVVSRQIILERGLYKERNPIIKGKNKVRMGDIPQRRPVPFNAKVMVAKPVASVAETHSPKPLNPKEKSIQRKKKTTKKKPKKIRKFETEENDKFVIHPMETPRNVVIKKRKVNTSHSIAFL